MNDYYDLFARYVRKLTEHTNSELVGLCPFHDDTNPSWAGNRFSGLWHCFGCGARGNASAFARRVGEEMQRDNTREIVATYPYLDEDGNLLYEVVRFEGKKFAQRRPGENGRWIWQLDGIRRVLYRLPEIQREQHVYIVEGEKDADRLWSIGIPSTTCPGGAGKWRSEYNETLRGKQVVILPDNDEPGEKHAQDVARSLLPVAAAVKIVRLPGLPPKGDVSDWLDEGHTPEELAEIVRNNQILTSLPGQALRLVTLRHPCEVVAPELSWRIENVLPDRMLTVLHARDKTGKTLLAWEMARAVLSGTHFLGNFATQSGRVVLALLDDPVELTSYRCRAFGLSDNAELRVVTPADADLADPLRFLDEFRDVCRNFEPSMIIIDALVHFLPPGREAGNDAPRMRPVMQKFNALAEELGAAVVLIAHDAKSGGDVAGSYVIRATAKTLLHLTRPQWSQEEEEDDGRRVLTVTSKLSGEARHLLRLEGAGAWTYVGRGDSARQARTLWAKERVLNWLGGGGEGTAQEVAKAARLRREDVLSALAALEEDGKVVSELRSPAGGGRGRHKRVYFIPVGNKIPKEEVGNKIPDARKPAQNAAQRDSIFVPPAWNLAGTKIDTPKPASNAGCSNGQEFCSRNSSSWEEEV